MGISIETLVAAKKFTSETVLGGGAVVGKNVTISSITPIDGGNRITFSYTLDNGTTKISTLDVMNGVNGTDGKNGIGISKIEKTKTEGLVDTYIITFSDDSTFEYTVTNGKDGKNGSSSSTGEENVIESIKVNGVAQTVAEDKSVDITVPIVDVDKNYVDTKIKTELTKTNGEVSQLKEDLSNKIDNVVTYLEETSTEDHHDINVSIPLYDGTKKFIEVTNTENSHSYRYVGVFINTPNGVPIINDTILLNANESKIIEIPTNLGSHIKRIIVNSNTKLKVFGYYGDNIKSVVDKNNSDHIVTYNDGYISNTGDVNSDTGYNNVTAFNIKKGDTLYFTGGYGWNCLFGYYSDGTAIPLLGSGTYVNKKVVIEDENIVMVKGFVQKPSLADIVFNVEENTANEKAYTIKDFTSTNYNSTLNGKDDINNTANFTATGKGGNFTLNSSIPLLTGDSVFMKCKLTSNKDQKVNLSAYSDTTDQKVYYVLLEKDKPEYVTFKFNPCTKDGTLNFQFSISEYSGDVTIDIQNLCIVINSTDCWYDAESKKNLLDYNTKDLIVDKHGEGHFSDIYGAINYAKLTFDVLNEPVNIHVKNGTYLLSNKNTVGYPYAFINKGFNKINIIGESKEHTILKGIITSELQGKILDIGGDCIIENLSIYVLNDGTYTTENDKSHNCYCIHNDTGNGELSDKYNTVIKNCYLYSEGHAPVGSGLHDKQTQKYIDSEFISNGLYGSPLYVHASVESYANNMGVIIDGCTCISKNNTPAIILPNVADSYGSLKYTDIPVTIKRTIGVTNGSTVTDVSKTTHDLQFDSALNNVDVWNY